MITRLLATSELMRLILDASDEYVAEIRARNRQRKRDKENEVGVYAPKSRSGSSSSSNPLGYLLTDNAFLADYVR